MLNEEVIEIITNELADFTASYFMMTFLSHGDLTLKKEKDTFLFGNVATYTWNNNKPYFNVRHRIVKTGRTKIKFNFCFHENELNFAMQLVRLLDGYVEYRFTRGKTNYYYNFEINVGSKANYIKFLDKLSFLD